MNTVGIPDGLFEVLHEELGGTLIAVPREAAAGQRKDSQFTIRLDAPVEDENIAAIVVKYYMSAGCEVTEHPYLLFDVATPSGTMLEVSMSNFTCNEDEERREVIGTVGVKKDSAN